jgi:hypothetical protein
MKQQQILICNLEESKRKIYFDLDTKSYGSVVNTEKNTGVGVIAGSSTLFYLVFNQFQNNFFQFDSPLFWYFSLTFIGLAIGMIFVYLKNKGENKVFLKKIKVDENELNIYLKLAEKQMSDSRTTIFLCLFTVIVTVFNVFFAQISITLILVTPLWIIIVYLLDYFDLSRRRRVLKEIRKEL